MGIDVLEGVTEPWTMHEHLDKVALIRRFAPTLIVGRRRSNRKYAEATVISQGRDMGNPDWTREPDLELLRRAHGLLESDSKQALMELDTISQ